MTIPAAVNRSLDAIFERRAANLAARRAAGAVAPTVDLLAFNVGGTRCAIELSELAEVLPYRGATTVPGVDRSLLGVINVRGDIAVVVDLRRILDVDAATESTAGYVLMLRGRERRVGLRVDGIDEVRRLDAASPLTPAGAGAVAGAKRVKALTSDAVLVLDVAAMLAHLGVAAAA